MYLAYAMKSFLLPATVLVFFLAQVSFAQDSNWNSSSQSQDPNGNVNPVRTQESHSEANGRSIDRTSTQRLGPDGQYVPYLDTEKETVRVDATTVRTTERTFGRGPDGQRTLVQVSQEESRSLPGGESNLTRTTSNPDANGDLQVVQRELQHTRQISPDLQETKTTVLTPDMNGGMAPAMQIEQREQKNGDGTIDFKTSTSLPDGTGHWQVGEVREGTRKVENGHARNTEERVLRPDTEGHLAVVERTVTRPSGSGPGDQREVTDTYSVEVPGVAGAQELQLVQRATTVRRTTASGERTTREVESAVPGSTAEGMRVSGQTIDIVRPGANGVAQQTHTEVNFDSEGRPNEVLVDTGKTDNTAVVHVDTGSAQKKQ
jgi:hypothetical protein